MPERGTVGFRGTEDYRWKLKRAAADRRKSLQKMLEDAVDVYLAAPPERLQRYARFLASADPSSIRLVEETITKVIGPEKPVRISEQDRETG